MLDTQSDYARNKKDKTAIVCSSVTGELIRLTREDFISDEEFERWKKWSDADYRKIENAGQCDSRCLSTDIRRDIPVPSAEDVVLVPYTAEEDAKRRRQIIDRMKDRLTEKQYRRICLYYLDGKTEAEIAALEGVGQRRISTSITTGTKIIKKFFEEFLCG